MPTYEYACTQCGQHVEVFQRFGDDSLTECGLCRGPLRKVFHPAGILFKGSGFYATDSRKPQKAETSSSESKPKTDSKPTTDSKPSSSESTSKPKSSPAKESA
jgi:putative FmdB family regulatory protein